MRFVCVSIILIDGCFAGCYILPRIANLLILLARLTPPAFLVAQFAETVEFVEVMKPLRWLMAHLDFLASCALTECFVNRVSLDARN